MSYAWHVVPRAKNGPRRSFLAKFIKISKNRNFYKFCQKWLPTKPFLTRSRAKKLFSRDAIFWSRERPFFARKAKNHVFAILNSLFDRFRDQKVTKIALSDFVIFLISEGSKLGLFSGLWWFSGFSEIGQKWSIFRSVFEPFLVSVRARLASLGLRPGPWGTPTGSQRAS